ncbi:hypothetical protein [Georgenia thermotolerans]|uniref:Uncharacterized protein n=1 Tax=Georgenia thermotolerans TaxID=527326 RepID=A0A7J5URB0_9MICO|nr:hypothetical protein [Georgenia thermotolerans]KAE8764956.1 hypothetical protein GB883_06090 [Georgenia thermotolerans]
MAVLAAATLATYVPRQGTGLRPDLGCSPCAAMAAATVLAAGWLVQAGPHQVSMAALAAVTAGFGLSQRLAGSTTCTV